MASSVSLNNAAVTALADKIVQARKMYGADSLYVIGLFAGIDMLLAGDGGEALQRQVQDRVLEMESRKASSPSKASAEQAKPRGQAAPAPSASPLTENEWIRGAVKWFNNDKGYGFISTESETDVFVHWRDISSWDRSLTQGDEVEFMVTKTAKGFQAINVMKSDQSGRGDQAAPEGGGAAAGGPAEAVDQNPAEAGGGDDGAGPSPPAEGQRGDPAASNPQRASDESPAAAEPPQAAPGLEAEENGGGQSEAAPADGVPATAPDTEGPAVPPATT